MGRWVKEGLYVRPSSCQSNIASLNGVNEVVVVVVMVAVVSWWWWWWHNLWPWWFWWQQWWSCLFSDRMPEQCFSHVFWNRKSVASLVTTHATQSSVVCQLELIADMNKLVPWCAWLFSSALKVLRFQYWAGWQRCNVSDIETRGHCNSK